MLEGCRARVMCATSTQEALALLGARPPDVLISDISMAGEDGYSLIRQLRAQERKGERLPARGA